MGTIGEIPTLELTTNEMKYFERTMQSLISRGYEKYGAVKCIPPKSWKCRQGSYEYNEINREVTPLKQRFLAPMECTGRSVLG